MSQAPRRRHLQATLPLEGSEADPTLAGVPRIVFYRSDTDRSPCHNTCRAEYAAHSRILRPVLGLLLDRSHSNYQ